jgi:hypothetical protein
MKSLSFPAFFSILHTSSFRAVEQRDSLPYMQVREGIDESNTAGTITISSSAFYLFYFVIFFLVIHFIALYFIIYCIHFQKLANAEFFSRTSHLNMTLTRLLLTTGIRSRKSILMRRLPNYSFLISIIPNYLLPLQGLKPRGGFVKELLHAFPEIGLEEKKFSILPCTHSYSPPPPHSNIYLISWILA